MRTFFTAVAQEGLAVLEQVALDALGHVISGGNRRAGDGADHADLIGRDHQKVVLGGAENKREQKMKAGAEDAGLHTDFVAQSHRATVGHLPTEPAPLQSDDLVAASDREGVIKENQQGKAPQKIAEVFSDEFDKFKHRYPWGR